MEIKSSNNIMVFKPTLEEFKDFQKYINYIESQGANKMGIAKIIAPDDWNPRIDGYEDINVSIPQPIRQKILGSQGKFQVKNIIKEQISSKLFKQLAENDKYRPPHDPTPLNMDLLERKYWKHINFNAPLYGADVCGSLYDKSQSIWDLRKLNTILDIMSEDYDTIIDGVTTTYLYFGMWKSTFAWHTEDMDLYSINYLHFGAPKFWYSIPTKYGRKFEQLVKLYYEVESENCSNFLRHKSTLISPTILQRHNIPYNKIQQYPREFIITFPYAYHAGFNTGYNCAESTNFAMPRWIEYGKRAIQCDCRPMMVRFSMKCFVRRFQPELLEAFQRGDDVAPHPEDGHCNTKLLNGIRGIQANPIFQQPDFVITELNESEEKLKIASKRIPSHRHDNASISINSSVNTNNYNKDDEDGKDLNRNSEDEDSDIDSKDDMICQPVHTHTLTKLSDVDVDLKNDYDDDTEVDETEPEKRIKILSEKQFYDADTDDKLMINIDDNYENKLECLKSTCENISNIDTNELVRINRKIIYPEILVSKIRQNNQIHAAKTSQAVLYNRHEMKRNFMQNTKTKTDLIITNNKINVIKRKFKDVEQIDFNDSKATKQLNSDIGLCNFNLSINDLNDNCNFNLENRLDSKMHGRKKIFLSMSKYENSKTNLKQKNIKLINTNAQSTSKNDSYPDFNINANMLDHCNKYFRRKITQKALKKCFNKKTSNHIEINKLKTITEDININCSIPNNISIFPTQTNISATQTTSNDFINTISPSNINSITLTNVTNNNISNTNKNFKSQFDISMDNKNKISNVAKYDTTNKYLMVKTNSNLIQDPSGTNIETIFDNLPFKSSFSSSSNDLNNTIITSFANYNDTRVTENDLYLDKLYERLQLVIGIEQVHIIKGFVNKAAALKEKYYT